MNMLYPYTDEPESERKIQRPLVTRNVVGRYVHVGKSAGQFFDTRNDLTVFVPNDDEWACTLEGNPDEPARAFVFDDVEQVKAVIAALQVALGLIEKRNLSG